MIPKAKLKVICGRLGAATFDLSCPVLGEYEVVVSSDECLDREFERFDPHRTTDAEVTMKYSQQALHFHSELQGEQSLSIEVKDAEQAYKVILMSPRSGDEVDSEDVIRAENIEVEYIPHEEEGER